MKFNVHLNLYNFDLLLEKKNAKNITNFPIKYLQNDMSINVINKFQKGISKIATNFTT